MIKIYQNSEPITQNNYRIKTGSLRVRRQPLIVRLILIRITYRREKANSGQHHRKHTKKIRSCSHVQEKVILCRTT